jgi:hypothetical protein
MRNSRTSRSLSASICQSAAPWLQQLSAVGKNAGSRYPRADFERSNIHQRLALLTFVGFSVRNEIILDEEPFVRCIMGTYSWVSRDDGM